MNVTIYPTGTCFDDALDGLAIALKSSPAEFYLDNYALVHAICRKPTGEEYSHAWFECKRPDADGGWVCYFEGYVDGQRVQVCFDRKSFIEKYPIVEETRYTPRQAWELNEISGHYGPWIERYRLLCADCREVANGT